MLHFKLEVRRAAERLSSQVLRTQPAVLGETRQHARADLVPIMEREDKVGPARTGQHLVRTGLTPDGPADAKERGENDTRPSAGPVAHAAQKEMLR